jgi:lysophospholipase L1-like esterase
MIKKICITLALCSSLAEAVQTVSPADFKIQTQGIRYVSETENGVRFQRHREDVLQLPKRELGLNPDTARNTSGGIITFKTDSREITARFKILSANYMGSGFGVFENGELIEEFKFNPKKTEALLKFHSTSDGASLFEIALPSFADVEFQGLDHTTSIFTNIEKPVYVALGDSISHGVGQDGYGHKTWPFLLSRKLNMELFNLAVGGGKISVPTAQMLEDWEQIDLITILIGYNDLHFYGKTPEGYREKYAELLDAIRKNHPHTKVVCITPLYTKKPTSKTGHTIEQFRSELSALVQERQANDLNLILIQGDTISSENNLRADNPKDPVHLGVEGAALLADAIAKQITEMSNGSKFYSDSR